MRVTFLRKCKTEPQVEEGPVSSKPRQPRKKQKSTHTTTSTPESPPYVPVIDVPESSDEEEAETSDAEEEADGEFEEEEEGDEEAEEEEEEEPQPQAACGKLGNPKADNGKTNKNKNIPLAATVTDADVFDCPICCENLRIPVHQVALLFHTYCCSSCFKECVNGHVACDCCCQKLNKKCPTCSWPMGYRSRIMERVLEVVRVSCGNLIYGCQHTMKLCDKRKHEYKCVYTRCSCPMQDCDFVDSASKLYEHFGMKHTATSFRFKFRFTVPIDKNTRFLFMTEKNTGNIFVLNQSNLPQGIAVSIVLIAPKSSTGKYRYELEAKVGKGRTLLESEVTSVTKLVDYNPTRYLVVLEDFLSSLGQVVLQIRIRVAEQVEEVKGNSRKK